MDNLKQCPNGHYYRGEACPYCITKIFPYAMGETQGESWSNTTRTMDTISTTTVLADATDIPVCPRCGKPVRKTITRPKWPIVGSIKGNAYDGKVPWNYLWNGRCEHCGHDFTLTMTQKISSPDKDRYTTVRVASKRVETGSPDSFIGLSGVEIEQRNSMDGVKKTFISTNELKYLINALKDSPILKQLDWSEDMT